MLLPGGSVGPSTAVLPFALADAQTGTPQLGFQHRFQAGCFVAFLRRRFHIMFSHILTAFHTA